MGITQQIGASSLIKPGVIDNTAARPASPFEGQVIFQKDTDQLLVWNGTAWVIPNQTTTNPNGLELVKTQTVGTTVSSVTVDNAFSGNYDHYKITYTNGLASQNNALALQLRVSGTTSVTGYYAGWNFVSVGGGNTVGVNNNATSWTEIGRGGTSQVTINLELSGPFQAKPTSINFSNTTFNTSGTFISAGTGFHNVATSYSDFVLTPSAGTLTGGTIRVYGYRNS